MRDWIEGYSTLSNGTVNSQWRASWRWTFRLEQRKIRGEMGSNSGGQEAKERKDYENPRLSGNIFPSLGTLFFIKKLCCSSLSKRGNLFLFPLFPSRDPYSLPLYPWPCVYLMRTRSSRLSFPIVVETRRRDPIWEVKDVAWRCEQMVSLDPFEKRIVS